MRFSFLVRAAVVKKMAAKRYRYSSLSSPELGALLYLFTKEIWEISLVCLIYAPARTV